jgi:hypothetical protein
MYFYMLVEICSLSKTEAATRDRTNIGSFIGMDAQMIEEVVPFAEMFAAVFMIAFEDLDVSLTLRVLEAEDPKLFRARHMFFDLN